MIMEPEKANARRLPGERVIKRTNAAKVRRTPRDVNATYVPPELCGWEVEPGVFWIQTTEPEFSRKLETRHDMRQVEMVGVKYFLRIFETRGRWRKIRRIIDRFVVLSAGGHFPRGLRRQNGSKKAGSVAVPPSANGENNAVFAPGGGQ